MSSRLFPFGPAWPPLATLYSAWFPLAPMPRAKDSKIFLSYIDRSVDYLQLKCILHCGMDIWNRIKIITKAGDLYQGEHFQLLQVS